MILTRIQVSRSVLLPAQPGPNAEAGRANAVEAQASSKLKAQASSKFPTGMYLLSSSLHVPLADIKFRFTVIRLLCLPPSNVFV